MNKAIINPEKDRELAEIISRVIDEYNMDSNYDKFCARGHCYNQSQQFLDYVDHEVDIDIRWYLLQDEGLRLIEGLFEIDRPEEMLLDYNDLYDNEYDEFMDLYGDNPGLDDPEELSYLIWEYIKNYASEDRIEEFYEFEHVWLETYNRLIIDFTADQFKNAINNNNRNIASRYEDNPHGK